MPTISGWSGCFPTIPEAAAESGFDDRDTPPFYDMHAAAAGVVGGTLAAMDRILAGEIVARVPSRRRPPPRVPGQGWRLLRLQRPGRRHPAARDAGHRVLYVDIDAHHGDGVESIFWDDPLVQTISIHDTGLTLFPGSGFEDDQADTEPRAAP